MYGKISKQPSTFKIYSDQLIREGVVTKEEVDALSKGVLGEMSARLEDSRDYKPKKSDWLASNWKGMLPPNIQASMHDTGVDADTLRRVGKAITSLPSSISPHRMISKARGPQLALALIRPHSPSPSPRPAPPSPPQIYKARAEMVESGEGVDWALGEQLAWGTLLLEGNHVRISGQACRLLALRPSPSS